MSNYHTVKFFWLKSVTWSPRLFTQLSKLTLVSITERSYDSPFWHKPLMWTGLISDLLSLTSEIWIDSMSVTLRRRMMMMMITTTLRATPESTS